MFVHRAVAIVSSIPLCDRSDFTSATVDSFTAFSPISVGNASAFRITALVAPAAPFSVMARARKTLIGEMKTFSLGLWQHSLWRRETPNVDKKCSTSSACPSQKTVAGCCTRVFLLDLCQNDMAHLHPRNSLVSQRQTGTFVVPNGCILILA